MKGLDEARQEKELALDSLVKKYKKNPSIKAVFLFGSYSRGTDKPESDIDLLVIHDGIFKKEEFIHMSVVFEVFFNNEKDTTIFWEDNPEDFIRFWTDSKLLFGNDDVIEFLRESGKSLTEVKNNW